MSQIGSAMSANVSRKETIGMDKTNLRNKRLKSLDNGKPKSLSFFEKLFMKYDGWVDGRKGLLRCNADGVWQSSVLKQEVDSYEEFCAEQIAELKIKEEDEFKQMNIRFDKVIPLRTKLSDAKAHLQEANNEEVDLSERKEGEDDLTEMQVIARRNRERREQLALLRKNAAEYETQLSTIVDDIFARLSQVKERFDSTVKISNCFLQHSQRRIDVYWRAAMCQMSGLPALPDVTFSKVSEQAFADHYNKVENRAEKLRAELETELYGEVM